MIDEKQLLQFGYKQGHRSNGITGEVNPDVDSHNFFLGASHHH
jgi:hypothetical protein